jgi:hypothetical protein
MKINANPTLPYSTLNPETNSDSPSAKSKGVRLVSANLIINHKNSIGKNSSIFIQNKFWVVRMVSLRVSPVSRKNRIIRANLTS